MMSGRVIYCVLKSAIDLSNLDHINICEAFILFVTTQKRAISRLSRKSKKYLQSRFGDVVVQI